MQCHQIEVLTLSDGDICEVLGGLVPVDVFSEDTDIVVVVLGAVVGHGDFHAHHVAYDRLTLFVVILY